LLSGHDCLHRFGRFSFPGQSQRDARNAGTVIRCATLHQRSQAVGTPVKVCSRFPPSLQEYANLRFLLSAVLGRPKLFIAAALLLLVALAATLTYSGALVVGVLADYLGASRFVTCLLLGLVFARLPWVSNGRLRIVALLPKPARRPVMVTLLALCCLSLLTRGDTVQALCTGFTTAFLLTFPWLKKAMFTRLSGAAGAFAAGRNAPRDTDDSVIEGEFRERKE
jgi:hypothetical protein